MANTYPVADTAGVVEQVWRLGREAGYCDVQPGRRRHRRPGGQAARRARRDGTTPPRGVRVFSDDGKCVVRRRADAPRAGVRQGLRRRRRPARAGAAAHRGRPDERGRRLGRARACAAGRPSPRSRSSPATCLLAAHVGSRLHVCHVSTAGSVEIVRWAKSQGLERHRRGHPAPPAAHRRARARRTTRSTRSTRRCAPSADVEALREALADGTIDVVATDHAPHPHEDKDCEWAAAAMGMVGLETALSVVQQTMVDTGLLDWAGVADRMSRRPGADRPADGPRPPARGRGARQPHARRPGVPLGRRPRASFASRAATRPYAGRELPGRVIAHLPAGHAPRVLDGKLARDDWRCRLAAGRSLLGSSRSSTRLMRAGWKWRGTPPGRPAAAACGAGRRGPADARLR